MAVVDPVYLTPGEIRIQLRARRRGRGLSEWHAEIERVTGMTISKSHLANILSGEKSPNQTAMKYLGGERVEAKVEYRIGKPAVKRKVSGR